MPIFRAGIGSARYNEVEDTKLVLSELHQFKRLYIGNNV